MDRYRIVWNDFIDAKAARSAWYQRLLKECLELEHDYMRIRNSLSEEDRDKLDKYISACEEMGYWKLQLASPFGVTEE